MKRIVKILMALSMLVPLLAMAETWTDPETGIAWSYSVSGGEARLYAGDYSPCISSSTQGAIQIPSTLNGYPVTSIGEEAFYGCSGLTSVTMPSSVTSIGNYAFCGCSGLTRVTIPSSVTRIGEWAFEDCSGLTRVTIPSSVTSIGEGAFYECSGLTEFVVDADNPNYRSANGLLLTKDGKTLVCGVNGQVTIPSSVTSIGDCAFYGCSGLTRVTIPEGVTSIGSCAFSGCSGLTSVTIPSRVTSIGDCAFYGCSGLTRVTIPSSVTSIGERAFEGCSGLTEFVVDADNPNYRSANGLLLTKDGKTLVCGVNGEVTIPEGVTSIGNCAFYGCSGLTSVTIPEGVTSIGNCAFYGCSGLTRVTIPSSMTSIGYCAFRGCSGLTHVTIPEGVTSVGDRAFEGCSGLGDGVVIIDNCVLTVNGSCPNVVVLPYGARLIVGGAFDGCSGLTSVTIPSSVTSIGSYAFEGCSGMTSVTIPSSVTSIGSYAFKGCSGLTSVTVPGWRCGIDFSSVTNLVISEGTTSIGNSAFACCDGLKSVTIPSSVTSIGDRAFDGCSGLTSVTIPSRVTSIGDCAFYGCSGLTRVTIPSSVTSIGDCAFADCSGLTSVTIPSSVTSIGGWAFDGCSGLGDGVVIIDNCVLTVNGSCPNVVVLPYGTRLIADRAFEGCSELTSVTIPSSVTSIGEWAFSGCSGLGDGVVIIDNCVLTVNGSCPNVVVLPYGTRLIADWAFDDCSGLTSVTIPSSVTSIGESAFYDCSGLTRVTISKGVTSIGSYAFSGCSGLTSVTIPSSVTSIGEWAFEYCSGLTSVVIPSRVTRIGEDAFWECDKLRTVYVSYGDAGRIENLYDWDASIAFVETDIQDETSSEEEPFDASIANTYDGVIVDSDGLPVGYICIKAAKASGKGDAKTSKVTATIQMVGEAKKVTVKASVPVAEATMAQAAADGRVLDLTFSRNSISGTFDGYTIEGARNLLASTAKSDKGTDAKVAADAVCAALKGNYVMAYEDENGWNGLTLSIASKGKVKVSGKLANGTSVSVSSQLIVGSEYSTVPIIYTKKDTSLAINVYFPNAGGDPEVFGPYYAVISPVGGLDSGLSFYLGEELYDLFEDYTLCDQFLPDDITVEPHGTKWVVADGAKAGSIKLVDGEAVDTKESANPSGLKLTFKAKTGTFSGSFKVYALDAKGKFKTFTATVSGVVVDGAGYGVATIKKIGSCAVVIAE